MCCVGGAGCTHLLLPHSHEVVEPEPVVERPIDEKARPSDREGVGVPVRTWAKTLNDPKKHTKKNLLSVTLDLNLASGTIIGVSVSSVAYKSVAG